MTDSNEDSSSRRKKILCASLVSLTTLVIGAIIVAVTFPYTGVQKISPSSLENNDVDNDTSYFQSNDILSNFESNAPSLMPSSSPSLSLNPTHETSTNSDSGNRSDRDDYKNENNDEIDDEMTTTPFRPPYDFDLPVQCRSPTEFDEEGQFYWSGAPMLDPLSSLASEDEAGTRIAIQVHIYASCAVNDDGNNGGDNMEVTEALPLSNRILDIWQPNADGYYDNAGFGLRGGYETMSNGDIVVNTILPGRNGANSRRRIHFKVWNDLSTTSLAGFILGGYVEELTSQWYFGDNFDEINELETLYGDRVIRLDQNNVGVAHVFINLKSEEPFYIKSEKRNTVP